MRRRKSEPGWAYVWPILLASALLAAGCGGGSSNSAATSTPATSASPTATTASTPAASAATTATTATAPPAGKAAGASGFLANADTTCKQINSELSATEPASTSNAATIAVVSQHADIERKGLSALRRLSPPASLAHDWQQILQYRGTLAGELLTVLHDTQINNQAGLAGLKTAKELAHQSLLTLATRAGFKDCGQVG